VRFYFKISTIVVGYVGKYAYLCLWLARWGNALRAPESVTIMHPYDNNPVRGKVKESPK
jgi:hypothetical protein